MVLRDKISFNLRNRWLCKANGCLQVLGGMLASWLVLILFFLVCQCYIYAIIDLVFKFSCSILPPFLEMAPVKW